MKTYHFGCEEVECYFKEELNSKLLFDYDDSKLEHVKEDVTSVLVKISDDYNKLEKTSKTVTLQRDVRKLWHVLFKQQFNLKSNSITV